MMFDVVIKKAVWGFLKAFSLGVNGAPRSVDDIDVRLELGGDHLYLELPADIVESVKLEQEPQLIEVQKLLYDNETRWSPNGIQERLQEIDFPMIHPCYYGNDECIAKVADWIEEPVQELLDGRQTFKTTRTVSERDGQLFGVVEEVQGQNAYRDHLAELQQKLGPDNTKWGKKRSKAERALYGLAGITGGGGVTKRLPPRWPPSPSSSG